MANVEDSFKSITKKYCKNIPVHNFLYSTNISLKHNYIYVETPKVACSSIKSTLIKMELENPDLFYNGNLHRRPFSPLLNPKQVGNFDDFINSSAISFCFIRNPYSRLLSAYLDKIVRNKEQKRNILTHLGLDPNNTAVEIPFKLFVETVCKQSIMSMNSHWRTQYYQTLQDNIEYDYIGKFESLNDDLLHILGLIRSDYASFISKKVPHATNASSLVMDYYTPELAQLVSEKFHIDFEYFGYSKNILEAVH